MQVFLVQAARPSQHVKLNGSFCGMFPPDTSASLACAVVLLKTSASQCSNAYRVKYRNVCSSEHFEKCLHSVQCFETSLQLSYDDAVFDTGFLSGYKVRV